MMNEVTKGQVTAALKAVGVEPGDGLLVHSALQYLGRPKGGPETYLEAIRKVLGAEGTVAVPTFNFGFAKGEDYDPATTPSDGMGVFSEFVRQQPEAQRTRHPMQSLAVLGKHADDLASRDTPSAFEDGSAYDRMLELGFKLLLLGCEIQYASMVHYNEERAEVPYRYWKDFSGRVKVGDEWEQRTYRMFVRDMEIDPYLVLEPIQEVLEARGQWASQRINYGDISLCKLADFVSAADDLLADDPWALVGEQPEGQQDAIARPPGP